MISRLKDTLLLVSDEVSDRAALREIFGSTYNLLEAENLTQAALLLEQNDVCVAAVLVDLQHVDDKEVQFIVNYISNEFPLMYERLVRYIRDGRLPYSLLEGIYKTYGK